MALFEIDNKILNKTKDGLGYRFFQDSDIQITLHLWEDRDADEGVKIVRFQIAHKDAIFEWDGKLKYGGVDSGEHIPGMKRSPIMIMQNAVNEKEREFLLSYLARQDHNQFPELIFLEEKLAG